MRKLIYQRDSGLRRPATRPLPGFLFDLRRKAGLTQRELGDKLKRHAKFIYDCEAGLRRIEVGEFIEWSLACKMSPLLALAEYGKTLGAEWAQAKPAPYPLPPLPLAMLNESVDSPAVPAVRKQAKRKAL